MTAGASHSENAREDSGREFKLGRHSVSILVQLDLDLVLQSDVIID